MSRAGEVLPVWLAADDWQKAMKNLRRLLSELDALNMTERSRSWLFKADA